MYDNRLAGKSLADILAAGQIRNNTGDYPLTVSTLPQNNMIFSNLRKILSLCMIGAIAATIAGFSETPKPEVAPVVPEVASVVPAVAGTTLPVQRTLTSADGRKLDVTILAKSATAIQARRTSDAKEFELEINKLSIEDKAFIAGLITPPIKKPTVLLIREDDKIQALLEKAGFEITIPPLERRQGNRGIYESPAVEKITDDEIKKFDVVWVNSFQSEKEFDRFLALVTTCKTVVWERPFKPTREKFLTKTGTENNYAPPPLAYIKSEGNLIFYNWQIKRWNEKTGSISVVAEHPEIFDQVIDAAKEQIRWMLKLRKTE